MGAKIIAEHQKCFPTSMGRLHHMHMVGPRSRRPLAEEQLAGNPGRVFRYVRVAKCLKRRDASLLCRFKAGYADQQVDDRLRWQTWDCRAADMFDGRSERAERT